MTKLYRSLHDRSSKQPVTRLKNTGAVLLFSVLALCLPANAQRLTEGDYTYVLIDEGEGAGILDYSGSAVNLVIPDTLGGKPVIEISNNVFRSNSTLQSVSFPNSVVTISSDAFAACTALTQLNLPDSLITINFGAFRACTALTQVTIPAAVNRIVSAPFYGCSALTQIGVHSNSLHFSSQDGVLFDKEKTVLRNYPGGKSGPYVIPGSVERIGDLSFHFCRELTEVTIPASVDVLQRRAFQNCTKLRIALFEGDVPTTIESTFIFADTAADFKVQFYEGAGGFTAPEWTTVPGDVYPSEALPRPAFSAWLNSFGLAADDLAANGEPLLISYALNLNPTNPAVRLPVPFVESSAIRLDFPTERPGVSLMVERSTDLPAGNWQPAGVETNSGTASVSIPLAGSESPEKLYLRFTVQKTE